MNGNLQACEKFAAQWGKLQGNFQKFTVIAWDRPVEGNYSVWAEKDWLGLSLAYRLKLRPHSVWKNGKRVDDETIDRFTLANTTKPRKRKGRR